MPSFRAHFANFHRVVGLFLAPALIVAGIVSGSAAEASMARTTARFTTYNVCAAKCPGLAPWSAQSRKIVTLLHASRPDVIGINELDLSRPNRALFDRRMKQRNYVRTAGSGGRYLYVNTRTMTSLDGTGTARLPSRSLVLRAHSRAPARGGAIGTFRHKKTGALFIVADVHLTALDTRSRDIWRLTEIKQAMRMVNSHKAKHPRAHTVLLGDFNSLGHRNTRAHSDSNRFRVNEHLRSRGYRDGRLKARSRKNSTASSINQVPKDRRRFPRAFQLDRFFVEPAVTVNKWSLANRGSNSYKKQYSDHDMIYMSATFPAR